MNDLSEVQNLVNAAYDCNLFCLSTATAELSTARVVRIEPDKRDRGLYVPPGFTRWIRAMGGDTTKAHVLSQVIYWYMKTDAGKPKLSLAAKGADTISLVKTYGDLGAEAGVTEKMAKDAITWARDVGVLQKEPHGFAGKKAMFISFTCARGADHLTDHRQVTDFAYPIQTHRSDSKRPTGPIQKDPQVFSNTQSTCTQSTYTNQDSATPKPVAKASSEMLQDKASGGVSKSTPVELPSTPKEPSPAQLEEKYLGPVPKSKTLPKGKQPLALAKVWEDALKAKYPGEAIVPLTQTECRQLAQIRKKLFDAGVEPNAAIRYIVQWWDHLGYHAFHDLARPLTKDPSVQRLLGVIGYAAKWYSVKSKGPVPFSAKPQLPVVKKPGDEAVAMKAQALADKIEQLVFFLAEVGIVVDLATLKLEPNDADVPLLKKLKTLLSESTMEAV
ncbi:hypothetical protein [Caballeronia sordidicola]|uniref:Uncharacterized protein n=1 Tax=Caballeronia sordidicola TaxID=196367 RepID=A0A242MTP9_CABSO|nr:hypothetical protein [Caballeronia sordidicola]OTP74439.1 hypothetical protein PAMC26510_16495 [Caballeronia sordidicola]